MWALAERLGGIESVGEFGIWMDVFVDDVLGVGS